MRVLCDPFVAGKTPCRGAHQVARNRTKCYGAAFSEGSSMVENPLWIPSPERIATSRITSFTAEANRRPGAQLYRMPESGGQVRTASGHRPGGSLSPGPTVPATWSGCLPAPADRLPGPGRAQASVAPGLAGPGTVGHPGRTGMDPGSIGHRYTKAAPKRLRSDVK